MDVEVNALAIVLATLSSMVVGAIWYAPSVFGNEWMKLAGIKNKKDKEVVKKEATRAIIVTIAVSFVTAYVLAHMAYLSNYFFQNSFLYDSLTTAFWAWLGFTAARFVTHDAFEGRRQKLTLLNMGHELVTLLAMALVIGLIRP